MVLIYFFVCFYSYVRSHSFGGIETANRFKRSLLTGSSSINVTSKQFKDNGTGLFLSTDVDYLQMGAYSSFKTSTENKEVSRIAGTSLFHLLFEYLPNYTLMYLLSEMK